MKDIEFLELIVEAVGYLEEQRLRFDQILVVDQLMDEVLDRLVQSDKVPDRSDN